jgi:hypothetical protein
MNDSPCEIPHDGEHFNWDVVDSEACVDEETFELMDQVHDPEVQFRVAVTLGCLES